jgi:hypothetical protein
MPHSEIIHIEPVNAAWRVYCIGVELELHFEQLGDALDAAPTLLPEGSPIRIVIHDAETETHTESDDRGAVGHSAAA